MMDESMSVIPLGLEPKTYCLEGSCSIQLSYGTSKSAAKLLLFWLTTKYFAVYFSPFGQHTIVMSALLNFCTPELQKMTTLLFVFGNQGIGLVAAQLLGFLEGGKSVFLLSELY